jgi:hypothetical protein
MLFGGNYWIHDFICVEVMIAAHAYLFAVCSCLAMCAGDVGFAESLQGADNFSRS